MSGKFTKLLEPGQIGKIKTKNRFIKTANGSSFIQRDGYVGDRAIAYYEALARGGVGLLIVESCGVEFPLACQHVESQFRLSDDKYIPSYAALAKAVHAQGCPLMIQFQHAGPWNPTGLLPKRDTKAASALTQEELPGPDFAIPRAMNNDEVKDMVNLWAAAAERAWKAGFDGCEINGGTCHQINTFLSRIWNKREDEYGPQSLENRARFISEIIKETKRRCGPDFTVTALINIREYNHPEATTMEEGVQLAKLLEKAGADAIQCRAHIYGHREGLLQPDRLLYPEEPKWLRTTCGDLDWSMKGHGAIWPLTAAVKKVVTVPVFASGRLNPEMGEQFLREGENKKVKDSFWLVLKGEKSAAGIGENGIFKGEIELKALAPFNMERLKYIKKTFSQISSVKYMGEFSSEEGIQISYKLQDKLPLIDILKKTLTLERVEKEGDNLKLTFA